MEVSEGLLVALMFITILTMAIAALLSSLVDLVQIVSGASYGRLQVVWIAFLLVALLNMFWHTVDLLEVEQWGFTGFLFVISGAILAFLAASVLTTPLEPVDAASEQASYLKIVTRFLLLFAILQAWIIGVDFVLGRGFVGGAILNAGLLAVSLALVRVDSFRVHALGAGVAWVLSLVGLTMRGFGVIE